MALSLAASGESEVAERLGVSGWQEEFAALGRDVRAIPQAPRSEHVLPAPETHSPSSLVDLETCPRRYYYGYVFSVPLIDGGMERARDRGTAVHAYYIRGRDARRSPRGEVRGE